jgi:WXG100 family type VII secretion target
MSGAGSNFRAELATMQVAAQHVYDVNAQIQSQLSNLLARLDPLTSTWQGSAATSFQVLKDRWHQDPTQRGAARDRRRPGQGARHLPGD